MYLNDSKTITTYILESLKLSPTYKWWSALRFIAHTFWLTVKL